MARKPVKVADFRINGKRMVIKDSKRRLWERYDDMPIGAWGNIVLPDEPDEETTKRTTRKGVKE
jgi:hypothetical protein